MMAYVGQARGSKLIAELEALGFGEMTVREELPPRRAPWVFDNGAFKDWRAGKAFDVVRYEKALGKLAADASLRPDFLVVPDIVADGAASLGFSEEWRPRLDWIGSPLYLVLQDGMTHTQVRGVLDGYAGVFVGGSLEWKLRTGEAWTHFAHEHGKRCHIGRMGTRERVRAARRWNVDSIDSCLPLWSKENLERFKQGFTDPLTGDFFA